MCTYTVVFAVIKNETHISFCINVILASDVFQGMQNRFDMYAVASDKIMLIVPCGFAFVF